MYYHTKKNSPGSEHTQNMKTLADSIPSYTPTTADHLPPERSDIWDMVPAVMEVIG